MIEDILPRLTTAGIDLELRELRDALWLAPHIVPVPVRASNDEQGAVPRRNGRTTAGWTKPPAKAPAPRADVTANAGQTELHAAGADGSDRNLHAMEARGPGVPALRHQLRISRALRPLKRRVPSRTSYLIDEAATAARAAEEGIWFPVFRPAPARWLELELVIDTAPSMSVWRRTSTELKTLIERLGAFRIVRTSALDTAADPARPLILQPASRTSPHVHQPRDLAMSAEPTRSRAILVVTDAIGGAWRDGRMDALLRSWGSSAPTGVVTMLPQRMWSGSGLRAAPGQLRVSAAGMANGTIESRAHSGQGPVPGPVPVTVMELSARWLAPWAELLAGSPGWRNVALLRTPEATASAEPEPIASRAAAEIVRQFRASASPIAFQLACYLSAAGLNLPVMRLVQQVMLPKSDTLHLAEVFLSGLLHAAPADEPAREDVTQYDFIPGVRDELNSYLVRDEMLDIVRETSRFVAERFGQPLDFSALLSDPEGAPLPVLGGDTGQPLAYVSATMLAKLGGRYRVLADRLATAAAAKSAVAATVPKNIIPAPDKPPPKRSARSRQRSPAVPEAKGTPSAATEAKRAWPPLAGAGSKISRSSKARSGPYFFLSYARTPLRDPADRGDPDRWVYKLYRDICGAILQMTDAPPSEAGFMDRENKLGTEWSPELVAALGGCRVFVPLYSRRYFESDNCGREWFAFLRREITHKARGSQIADAIVPALWTRIDRDKLPHVAQSVQFDHNLLGERYSAEGFYGIMKLQSYRADYQRAVHRLAERIIAIGDESVAFADEYAVTGITRADFESLPSAFGPASPRRTADGRLQIVVLAHDTSTLPPGITSAYYGDTPRDWSPYRPDYPQPIADYALELAKKCLDVTPIIGRMEDIRRSSPHSPIAPTLVLVDPRAAISKAYEEQLRELNEMQEPWVSVLVPWNSQDSGMYEARHELRERLQQNLGHKLANVPRRCEMAATGIPTLQDFGQLLPEMTMIMMKRFRKEAAASPPAGPIIERPRLRRADPEGR